MTAPAATVATITASVCPGGFPLSSASTVGGAVYPLPPDVIVVEVIIPFFSVNERVPDLCIFAIVFGKNVDEKSSTSNGISSGPITPGCCPGIEIKFLAAVNTSSTKLINITTSAKYTNPAG